MRIWADERGDSHLEHLTPDWHEVLDYARNLPPLGMTEPMAAKTAHFVKAQRIGTLAGGGDETWHPSPRRQLGIILQGRLEQTTSDATTIAEPGDVFLLEDTSGSGHRSVVLDEGDFIMLMVTLPDAEA
jgi:hypothetical protein